MVEDDEPRPARRAKKARKEEKESKSLFSGLTGKPLRILAFVVAAGVLVGIGLNATLFQTTRHPAPLFANSEKVVPPKPATPQAAPTPAPRPADLAGKPTAQPRTQSDAPRKNDPVAALIRGDEQPTTRKGDPIASLLRGEEGAAAPAREPQSNPRVAAAQRALQKVGYVVKPSGVMGPQTKQAIEKFERDRNLPVTGQLAGRTLKELAGQSGVAIP
jgi:hypothetical protein